MTSVLVHSFVMDPIWKTESAGASTPGALLRPRAAPSTTSPSWSTAQAAAGTPYFSSRGPTCSSSQLLTSLIPPMGHTVGSDPQHGVRRGAQVQPEQLVGLDNTGHAPGAATEGRACGATP